MTRDGDLYTLTNGRTFTANRAIVGISPDRPLSLSEGYDGMVNVQPNSYLETGEFQDFTADERREVADFFIALWNEWAA